MDELAGFNHMLHENAQAYKCSTLVCYFIPSNCFHYCNISYKFSNFITESVSISKDTIKFV